MSDKAEILEVLSSGALDGIIKSLVKETITNSDQMNEALYKKGCGLMKKVFEDNEETYSDKISEILKEEIKELFKVENFKSSLTSTLVDIMKELDYQGYIVEGEKEAEAQIAHVDGGSKTLHNKTFKKPRKGNKRKKQNK